MAKTPPRIALVPHTAKPPERCPHCSSTALARKGIRKKRIEIVQLWRCGSCKRVFTPGPVGLRNKTYPLRIALDALTLYSVGYSVDQITEKIRLAHGHQVGRSTIAAWVSEHRPLITYSRLRADGKRHFPPAQTIRSIKLYHRQVYKFAYHRPKLALLREDRQHARFTGVANFLERVRADCPDELFRGSEQRASQARLPQIKSSRLLVITKENAATRMAALVIPTVGDNRLRHEALQAFMLAADSATIAVEVPIWLTAHTIADLEHEYGAKLLPEGASGPLTGHIDFLQIRNGAVHILDYKPDARTNRPIAQLTIYALALTKLIPGLALFDIKCAWFNENEYCEFFPRKVFCPTVPGERQVETTGIDRTESAALSLRENAQ